MRCLSTRKGVEAKLAVPRCEGAAAAVGGARGGGTTVAGLEAAGGGRASTFARFSLVCACR